jgi:hypothetical protein
VLALQVSRAYPDALAKAKAALTTRSDAQASKLTDELLIVGTSVRDNGRGEGCGEAVISVGAATREHPPRVFKTGEIRTDFGELPDGVNGIEVADGGTYVDLPVPRLASAETGALPGPALGLQAAPEFATAVADAKKDLANHTTWSGHPYDSEDFMVLGYAPGVENEVVLSVGAFGGRPGAVVKTGEIRAHYIADPDGIGGIRITKNPVYRSAETELWQPLGPR